MTPEGSSSEVRPWQAPGPAQVGLSSGEVGKWPRSSIPLLAYFSIVLVAPVLVLLLYSFWTAGFFTVIPEFTLENYAEAFGGIRVALLVKTLLIGFTCALILAGLGLIVAYALTFKMGKWGQRLLLGIVLSLLASYLVRIYAWTTILGTEGILNRTLIAVGLIDDPLRFLLYGQGAVVVTLVYVYLPFSILIIYAGLQNMDASWIEASKDLGAGRVRTFRQVTLPQAMPAVRSAFALCFILTTTDYVTPGIVGGLRGQMFGNAIESQFGGGGNFPQGAALSFVLVVGMLLALAVAELMRMAYSATSSWRASRFRSPRSRTGAGRMTSAFLRFPVSETIAVTTIIYLAIPLVTVVFFSFNSGGVPGLPFRGFSLRWYQEVFTNATFHQVFWTSARVIAVAVTAALLLSIPAAFALARHRFRAKPLLQIASFGPVTIPGIMVGVALLSTLSFFRLSNGIWPTIAAHTLLVVPVIVLVAEARLRDLDREIEEAARDLGSSPRRVLRTIVLPIIAPALAGAAVLAAAISLDETIVTNFVAGTDPTVPIWILSRIRLGVRPSVNAIATLLLVASVVVVVATGFLLRKNRASGLTGALGRRQ